MNIYLMRKIILLIAIVLPQPFKIFLYRHMMGWKIGKQVKIGLSYIDADEVIIGDNVHIGHFNIIRGLWSFQVGNNSYISNFNDFFGNKSNPNKWASKLVLGEKISFMSHHYVDVSGNVTIGSNTTVGGRDTHFWSHTRTFNQAMTDLLPIDIHVGENVYIGARATLVGCNIPNGTVVGAGSIVNKTFAPENCRFLIAGNPATIKKRY
ncbi:MAG: hypothetical protein F6K41_03610 [Symploca sp. SIO3E6]|nr:hypothetical protein [Caldora sp. SIO3E6]